MARAVARARRRRTTRLPRTSKIKWSLGEMLHTWQNAAYLGDLNSGNKFGKKFGKSENDLVFWKMTGRSLGWVNLPATNLISWISTRAGNNTLYNGIKIVVLKDKILKKFFQMFFQLFQTFPNSLEISKEFGKKFGKKWQSPLKW
jgi:hypothetical protein